MSRDRTVGDTFYIAFTTRAFATGIPTTLAGTPVISAYEDAGLTQITAGLTLGVDHDGVTGMNMITVVATGGNGFETGKDYQLVITTGTVGGVSVVGEVVGQFSLGLSAAATEIGTAGAGLTVLSTQASVDTIDTNVDSILVDTAEIGAAGAGLTALATQASVNTIDTNVDSILVDTAEIGAAGAGLTVLSTQASVDTIDTNVDSILVDTAEIGAAGAGLTDITINAASVDAVWDEVLTGATHNVTNSGGKRLRQAASLIFNDGTAQAGTANTLQLAAGAVTTDNEFVRAKVIIVGGTGAGQEAVITDSVASTDTITTTPAWLTTPDATSEYQVLPGQVHTTVQNGGYEGAAVFVDTVNGTAGTLTGVNGTSTNPVDSLADAFVIATANNITRFRIQAGSAVTLPADSSSRFFIGRNWSLALNGSDITSSFFEGALTTGTATGTVSNDPTFVGCLFGDVTLPPSNGFECGFFGTFTLGSAGSYTFGGSADVFALGLVIDFGAGLNASGFFMPSWGGGQIEIQNAGAGTGTYVYEMSGNGDLVINANCSATTNVKLRGNICLTNNASGITIDANSNFELDNIISDSVAFKGQDVADILADTAEIGTAGAGLTNIGTIATVTDVTNQVTADVTAISGDSTAADNLEASLETLVLGTATGSPTTTTMPDSALTEATNDHYNGRVIIWRTGVLAGQATDITGYNGGTKTFTFTATTDAPGAGDAYVIV